MCCVSVILIAISMIKIKNDSVHEFINVYTIVFIMNVGNAHEFLIYYLILIFITLWKILSISSPGQSIFFIFYPMHKTFNQRVINIKYEIIWDVAVNIDTVFIIFDIVMHNFNADIF